MVNSRGLWITSSILLILVLANSYYIYSLNGQVSALRDEIGELSGSAESSLSAQAHSSSIIIAERSIPIVAVLNDETVILEKKAEK